VRFDFAKLGGALLAAGPCLMQFVSDKRGWWIGLGFTVIGPFLLSVKRRVK